MPLLVQKFGGTLMGSADARAAAVARAAEAARTGDDVVVVVSAMGRRGDPYATDTLLDLFGAEIGGVEAESYGMMYASGELIAAALFSHALNSLGVPAQPLTGAQAGMLTSADTRNAQVLSVDLGHIIRCLSRRRVAVVAGGQGMCPWTTAITSLGRGGSDTTAAALAARLEADALQLFKDVPGVAAVDPRLLPSAPVFREISYAQMHEMACWGAQVISPRAIDIAKRSGVPIEVLGLPRTNSGTTVRELAHESDWYAIVSTGPIRSRWSEGGALVGKLRDYDVVLSPTSLDAMACDDRSIPAVGAASYEEPLCWVSVLSTHPRTGDELETARSYLRKAGVSLRLYEQVRQRQTYVVEARDERLAIETLYDVTACPTRPDITRTERR